MSFEELEVLRGPQRDATKWYIGITSKGGVVVYVPRGCAIYDSQRCVIALGKGPDSGWMMLRPASKGDRNCRAVNKSNNDKFRYIKFSTLPFAPRTRMAAAEVKLEQLAGGVVKIWLPWIGSDGKPLPLLQAEVPKPATSVGGTFTATAVRPFSGMR